MSRAFRRHDRTDREKRRLHFDVMRLFRKRSWLSISRRYPFALKQFLGEAPPYDPALDREKFLAVHGQPEIHVATGEFRRVMCQYYTCNRRTSNLWEQ